MGGGGRGRRRDPGGGGGGEKRDRGRGVPTTAKMSVGVGGLGRRIWGGGEKRGGGRKAEPPLAWSTLILACSALTLA